MNILNPTITPTITRWFIAGFGSFGHSAERASGSCTITRPCSCGDLHMIWVLAWVIVVFFQADVLLWFNVHVPIWKHLSILSRIVRGTSVKLLSVFVHFTKRSPICWAGRQRVSKAVSRVIRHRPGPSVPEKFGLPCHAASRQGFVTPCVFVCHCQSEANLT